MIGTRPWSEPNQTPRNSIYIYIQYIIYYIYISLFFQKLLHLPRKPTCLCAWCHGGGLGHCLQHLQHRGLDWMIWGVPPWIGNPQMVSGPYISDMCEPSLPEYMLKIIVLRAAPVISDRSYFPTICHWSSEYLHYDQSVAVRSNYLAQGTKMTGSCCHHWWDLGLNLANH